MKYLLIEYPKCSTCQKAKKFLQEHEITFQDRNIVEERPTEEEIKNWIATYHLDIKKLFNTSGLLYKKLQLKEKLETFTQEEKIKLLASDGMLVKRPILIGENIFLNGFKQKDWEEKIVR